jgi:hypothetical protein
MPDASIAASVGGALYNNRERADPGPDVRGRCVRGSGIEPYGLWECDYSQAFKPE